MDLYITMLLYSLIIIFTFIFMEGVAWFLHKYVMHGFGWYLHEDHHRYKKGKFEKNDVFGLFFSLLSFILIMMGFFGGFDIRLPIGIGVACYGIGYFLVHDIFFHRRIRIKHRPQSSYMKRVLNAHAMHHQKSTEHQGICFGFLYADKKFKAPSQ